MRPDTLIPFRQLYEHDSLEATKGSTDLLPSKTRRQPPPYTTTFPPVVALPSRRRARGISSYTRYVSNELRVFEVRKGSFGRQVQDSFFLALDAMI